MAFASDEIAAVVERHGGIAHGFVPLDTLRGVLPPTGTMARRFEQGTAGYESALIVAFSYFAECELGNIALFARGEEYVAVMKKRLTAMAGACATFLPVPPKVLPNGWPLPVVAAARLAGVGMTGLHGLCICPPYGSFVSLGALLWPEPAGTGRDAGLCSLCGACVRACPTGALQWDAQTKTRVFLRERCLSHLTQKEGMLTPEEEALLRGAPCLWGCDICQGACPHNRAPTRTHLPEFLSGLTASVTPETARLTAPPDRHYLRKGMGILERNTRLRGS